MYFTEMQLFLIVVMIVGIDLILFPILWTIAKKYWK
jgi:hypothetical protein